jgi:hypothetical protein
MPVAKLMDEGENRLLNIILGATPVDGVLYLGLYKNPSELEETAKLTDLTEPSGSGYGRKIMIRGSWTITNDHATYTPQTFLAQGGDWGNVTGYFIATSVDNNGKLLATEHFDVALNLVDGKGVKIQPKITVG